MNLRTSLYRGLLGGALCLLPGLLHAAVLCADEQAAPVRGSLTGVVQDTTGAIISGARVQLLKTDSSVVSSTATDSVGQFQLPQPAPGTYTISVTLQGFSAFTRTLRVTTQQLAALAITMSLASVATDVTVNADQDLAVADPASNADAASVTADDMKSLPVFDGDIVATLSAFLDAGVAGEGGTTLVIDGVESKTVGVSPSAIERVSVNQDPYSAQYRQPGRGQVEIVTKSTADHFHGAFTFTFRDAALNAKNYFAVTKPHDQRRIYEGYLTGPVPIAHGNAFLFSLTRREQDRFGEVNAIALPAQASGGNAAIVLPTQNVPAPARSTQLTMKVSHQYSDRHSAYLLYRFDDESVRNQNAGGLVQSSAGYASYNFDMDLTYHDDLTISANKLNQFSFLFERNLDRTTSTQKTPQVLIEGVATLGGAQQDAYNTEHNPNLSDIFSWTLSSRLPQQLKFGVQMPNLGRRILEDETNRQGTYTYASLAAYQANAVASFSIQQGQTRFETLYAQPGAFILDQIQVTPNLTITPGLRYEFQNEIADTKDAFQPRLSVAYVLDKAHALVVRAGSGIYFRHVGVNIGQQLARYQNAAERSLLNTANPCYLANAQCNSLTNNQPPSLYIYQPGLQSPVQAYFGLSLERQVTKQSTVTLGYSGYRGWHALRSIDINAPLPPFTGTARPDPDLAQVLQLNSGGYQKTDGLNLSYRGRVGKVFTGFLQYTWQHADADTTFSTFFPQNQYRPNDEWSRSDFDQRQRFSFFGTLYPDKPLTLGVGVYANTPLPYTVTTGSDDFHTGLFNARPAGVARNTLNGGSFQDLQLRLGYTHKLRALQKTSVAPDSVDYTPQTLAFSVSSFNTLNRASFEDYVGVVSSPNFMHPTAANPPRRIQLSAAYTF